MTASDVDPDTPAEIRFGLVVVLYQPQPVFVERLLRLRQQCACMVVVDNSPRCDPDLQRRLHDSGLELISNQNQGGLAGAYNRGAARLQAQGCELMFWLDQDSQLADDYFATMVAGCGDLRGQAFLIGPKIYETRLERYMPALQARGRWFRAVPVDQDRQGLIPSLILISSGSAVSTVAWQQLGAFREDYFIEYIDIEYALRAGNQGIPVYINTAAELHQNAGDIVRHGRHFSTRHPAWRRYYSTRNAIDCLRRYPRYRRLWLVGLALLGYQAVGVLLFERGKSRKLLAMLLGLLDGWRRRLGPLESRHRRWSRAPDKTEAGGAPVEEAA